MEIFTPVMVGAQKGDKTEHLLRKTGEFHRWWPKLIHELGLDEKFYKKKKKKKEDRESQINVKIFIPVTFWGSKVG